MSNSPNKSPKEEDNQEAATSPQAVFANAFDEQIKLVEKSIADSRGEETGGSKKKADKKPAESKAKAPSVKQTASQSPQKEKVFSNRSRIYRFDAADGEEAGLSRAPTQVPFHPPTELQCDSLEDADSEPKSRASMLTSWYMAGYHTGYYDAMRRHQRDLD